MWKVPCWRLCVQGLVQIGSRLPGFPCFLKGFAQWNKQESCELVWTVVGMLADKGVLSNRFAIAFRGWHPFHVDIRPTTRMCPEACKQDGSIFCWHAANPMYVCMQNWLQSGVVWAMLYYSRACVYIYIVCSVYVSVFWCLFILYMRT